MALSTLQFYDIPSLKQEILDDIFIDSIDSHQDPFAIYEVLKNIIIPELEKQTDYKCALVPLPMSSHGMYWLDYPRDYVRDYLKIESEKLFIFVIYLTYDIELNITRGINVLFDSMSVEEKKIVINLFESSLLGYFQWNGTNNRLISIKYEKDNIDRIDQNKLKDNDAYSQIHVNLYMNNSNLFDVDITDLHVFETIINIMGCDIHYDYCMNNIIIRAYDCPNYTKQLQDALNIYIKPDNEQGIESYSIYYYTDKDSSEYYHYPKKKKHIKNRNKKIIHKKK